MTLLEVETLTKRFGDFAAVDALSFEVRAGETVGLLGPNGCGKSTSINMICGILTPTSGSVLIGGNEMTPSNRAAKARIGLVPQDIALYQDLSTRENLQFFGRLQGLGGSELDRRIDAVLDIVALRDRADDRVDEYSGGMKRRCNIAVGMLHEPELLILDEPTVGVDPQSRNQILDSVERLGSEGLAVIYTTHYMEEAERLCERVVIMDQGKKIAAGPKDELVSGLGDTAGLVVEGSFEDPTIVDRFDRVQSVSQTQLTSRGLEFATSNPTAALGAIVPILAEAGVPIEGISVTEPNLEAVFLELTGRALRD